MESSLIFTLAKIGFGIYFAFFIGKASGVTDPDWPAKVQFVQVSQGNEPCNCKGPRHHLWISKVEMIDEKWVKVQITTDDNSVYENRWKMPKSTFFDVRQWILGGAKFNEEQMKLSSRYKEKPLKYEAGFCDVVNMQYLAKDEVLLIDLLDGRQVRLKPIEKKYFEYVYSEFLCCGIGYNTELVRFAPAQLEEW